MADNNGENQNADAADSDRTKSFVELEKKLVKVQKIVDEYFWFMNDLDRDDWFSVYNSITSGYDPHTNYFAPEEKNVLMLASVVN
jgi:carboxyl-terminal processing protease